MNLTTEQKESGCIRCYATFRLFSETLLPDFVTEQLGVQPARVWEKGSSQASLRRKQNGWFLTSKGEVSTLDAEQHLSWLANQLITGQEFLTTLAPHSTADIMCFWHSAGVAEGGPTLSAPLMAKLSQLNLAIKWSIYH